MQTDDLLGVLAALLVPFLLGLPAPVVAQFDTPPEIVIQSINGGVSATVVTDGDIDGDQIERVDDGRFAEGLAFEQTGPQASVARAQATQNTDVSRFLVSGRAFVQGYAFRDTDPGAPDPGAPGIPPRARANAASDLSIEFTVPVDAEFTLQGSFNVLGDCCLATGTVSIAGIDADGAVFFQSDGHNVGEPDGDFLITGTVGANQTINFGFSVDFLAQSDDVIQLAGRGSMSIDFDLDFGDRDGDGLLDTWEENGIDFAGPGIEIDLPALGADPDHKDIFVELDLMDDVLFSANQAQGLSLVAAALRTAPSFEVDNPDGQPGITLHIVRQFDERVPFEALSGTLSQILDRLDDIKAANFGSADDRANPAIIEARRQIFRYALWADTINEDGELLAGAATIGGPNFVIAAGSLSDRYSLSSIGLLEPYALAGAFGHELGHSLGLDHGGRDSINYKPNYISIMNYAYNLPIDRPLEGGGNLATTFFVDYARYELCGFDGTGCPPLRLSEGSLLETETIANLDVVGGVPPELADRFMHWNSASEFDAQPVQRVVGPVLGEPDWNNNGTLDTEAYARDLTRIDPSTPANNQILEPGGVDYRFMRTPIVQNPLPRSGAANDPRRAGMRFSELDLLESLPTINGIPQRERIFRSGFELTQGVVEY